MIVTENTKVTQIQNGPDRRVTTGHIIDMMPTFAFKSSK